MIYFPQQFRHSRASVAHARRDVHPERVLPLLSRGAAVHGRAVVVPPCHRDVRARGFEGVASALAMGVLSFAASRAEPALAFGSGIPGYDINEKARSAIRDANNKELDEQKRIAREFREAKAREREAAAASSAPATEAGEAQ
jgi:hypothetical protein